MTLNIETEEFGRIRVRDVPLPAEWLTPSAAYTSSGRVLVLHKLADDPAPDWYHVAVLDDDGTGIRHVFHGRIPQHAKANGIRHMIFADNRRVLLGDHVLECTPSLDECDRAELLDVEYPWALEESPLIMNHWSEIIVSPDGEHIAWTILRSDMGADAALGRLRRAEDRYVIEDPQLISTPQAVVPDPERPGYVRPAEQRGGEVKQFVRGGTALSIVGAKGGVLPDSVIQDLATERLEAITRTPGYDETTMLSPDEQLGLVMTSRASATTNPAIIGLVPRPHGTISGMGLAWIVYFYTVAGVRRFRRGNVGPVLIDIERSQNEPGYVGVALNDPDEEWVYVSPMSWRPDGRRVMWMETLRGSETAERPALLRVRVAELLDRTPGEPPATQPTPADIPYGIRGADAEAIIARPTGETVTGRIAGGHSGYLEYERRAGDIPRGIAGSTTTTYVDYSDDGRTWYRGSERNVSSFVGETVYEAQLDVSGEASGEMRLRVTWSSIRGERPATLLFEEAEDGRPKSVGFARWGGTRLDIADLAE